MWPSNLAAQANRDLNRILDRSAETFGEAQAVKLQDQIVGICRDIADGVNHGHAPTMARVARSTRFIIVDPIIIAYNFNTKRVVRIVDGRRNLSKILR